MCVYIIINVCYAFYAYVFFLLFQFLSFLLLLYSLSFIFFTVFSPLPSSLSFFVFRFSFFVFRFFNFPIFVMYGYVCIWSYLVFSSSFFFPSPFHLYFLSLWWKKHYLAVCVRARLYEFLFFFHLVLFLLVDSFIHSSSLFLFALLRFFLFVLFLVLFFCYLILESAIL